MKLAIVTGGSRGLGAALCEEYLGRGWQVVEFSRSAPFEHSVRLDMSDASAAARLFPVALGPLARRRPDEVIAFSNAGVVGPVGPVESSSTEAVIGNLTVNVVAGVLFARAFVAAFGDLSCPRTLVNISSGAASRGEPGWSLYCAGKAAMENFVRSVALEQAAREHPVRVFSVNPGVMDTAMQEAVRSSSRADFPAVGRYRRLHEEGRLAPPSVVAGRIAEIVASRPEGGQTYTVA